ncbi:hypothetical protein EHF33_01035 [Deinococcus psychrotolerans]|uniref:Transmembrane protein n=1 Tax=Deinococcus psychrotolerans TaxID=2489213 RepID=A0A3G8YG44_9DEIO|nr:hypothetical protein [Deinococcus psychrotolerans]AZI41514.1 hypothetical protein EHF33_01035 [Deinococcus psychrotolerans]
MWLTYLMAGLTALLAFHAFQEGGPLTVSAGVLALCGSVWAIWLAYTWPRQKGKLLSTTLTLPVIALSALQRLAEHHEHGPHPTQHEVFLVGGMVIGSAFMVWSLLKDRSSEVLEQKWRTIQCFSAKSSSL